MPISQGHGPRTRGEIKLAVQSKITRLLGIGESRMRMCIDSTVSVALEILVVLVQSSASTNR